MEDIVKIVEREIINKMNLSLELTDVIIIEVVPNEFVSQLFVCNIKWARKGKTIKDENDVVFEIIDVDYSLNKITVDGEYLGTKAFIYLPYYFHGTPMETNAEWIASTTIEMDKIPFVWLIEPVTEKPFGKESSLERESDLRLLFIDSRDATNWLVKDVHNLRTQSLLNLEAEFERVVKENTIFKTVESTRIKNITQLGTESANGFVKNIIEANLTAIELRFTLPIFKGYKCDC